MPRVTSCDSSPVSYWASALGPSATACCSAAIRSWLFAFAAARKARVSEPKARIDRAITTPHSQATWGQTALKSESSRKTALTM